MTGYGTFLFVPPGAPLVHHQSNAFTLVVAVHNVDMFPDDRFNAEALAKAPVVIIVGELCSLAARSTGTV